MKKLSFIALLLVSGSVLASGTYVPPPPPKLPEILSDEMVDKGRNLFKNNYWSEGKLEIHNILGRKSCGSCHDKKEKLSPSSLAKNFKNIREKINSEIRTRSLGEEVPIESPMMEALVQYMVRKYKLQEYKLPK